MEILRHHDWFPSKIMLEEEQRNSILMMVTTQIWVVILLHLGHQYGISAVVLQVSFHGDHTSGATVKCWLFLRLTLFWFCIYRAIA